MKDIEADTVTAELKTDKNKLSVWRIENEDDLNDAFIALGSNCSSIGTIWAVKLSPEELGNLEFDNEEGNTPTNGINQKHRNITELNYSTLGNIIMSVIASIREKDRLVKKTKSEMRILLAEAYIKNRLQTESLEPKVLEEITKEAMRITNP